MEDKKFVSGFVSIIGLPNVGKSTLLNKILNKKIMIMTNKPQTTRNKVSGIFTDEFSQIIFIDTPGIHKPKSELGKRMNNMAYSSIKGVDAIFFMISSIQDIGRGNKMILESLKDIKTPVYLIVNKIDLIKKKQELYDIINMYKKEMEFKDVFPISALNGDNVDLLVNDIRKLLPAGPMYYPKDQVSDHPEKFIIAEIIREKVIIKTHDEVPHSIAVIIESLEQTSKNAITVMAQVIVERTSQKGIIIGNKGAMIKDIGILARKEIQSILGSRVHLELFVKVKKDWRNKQLDLKNFGFETN